MCATEVWTYQECGCRYLHRLPCDDCRLLPPNADRKSHSQVDRLDITSGSSSVASHSSATSWDGLNGTNKSFSASSSVQYQLSLENIHGQHDQRLHRTCACSVRHTLYKTFLEPICDECLLAELPPTQESDLIRQGSNDKDESRFDGDLLSANWLLESRVEITIDPPLDNEDQVLTIHSNADKVSAWNDSSDEAFERGRAREKMMGVGSSLFVKKKIPALKKRPALRRLRRKRNLPRPASENDDLKNVSQTNSRSLSSWSWIEHLKSDFGQRVRRKRLSISRAGGTLQRSDSTSDVLSIASEDIPGQDRALKLSCSPTAADCKSSPGISIVSSKKNQDVAVTPDQLVSSMESESSRDCDQDNPPETETVQMCQPSQPSPVQQRPPSARSLSVKPLPTTTPNATPPPSSSTAELTKRTRSNDQDRLRPRSHSL